MALDISPSDKRAFVDFYNSNSIMPVGQDFEDPCFIFQRAKLYHTLGIPLPSLRGRSVIEFGPGGGYNAIAVCRYSPSSYAFVDAAEVSLEEIGRKKSLRLFGNVPIEAFKSNIFDFEDVRFFDLVILEGILSIQTKPVEMLRHASSFVAECGYLTLTTTSNTSYLSEICRRLWRPFIIESFPKLEDQVKLGVDIFSSHLKSLSTKTRPVSDWVLDSIIHPWESDAKHAFTMINAISSIEDGFEFLGSSPRFLIDDRFYKKLSPNSPSNNDLVKSQYPRINLYLLDYRVSMSENFNNNLGTVIDELCEECALIHNEILSSGTYSRLQFFLQVLSKIGALLPDVFNVTKRSLDDFARDFPQSLADKVPMRTSNFTSWWGRGQQYVSFTRKE